MEAFFLLSLGAALAVVLALLARAYGQVAVLRREVAQLRAAAAAQEEAEAATRARSRFLAIVSHEIRTPLNGVSGLAQLLGMTRLGPEQASYVEAILESCRALGQLIDDILDFSKIEAGRLELRSERFAPAALVESLVELLAPRAHAKGLEIASFISPEASPEIMGDPARLRQILLNLLGNAVNFTERGGVGVRMWCEGETLRIDVRDTGPGVPAEAREAIFEEFTQVDASATRRQGGTGLGLAISRRLVQLMGGALFLSETSSGGSAFSLALPSSRPLMEAAASRPLDGRRVMIVAQSLIEAPYLARTLEAAGAQVVVAAGADAPARLSHEEAGDVVIIDCALGAETVAGLARAAQAGGAGRLFLLFSPLERRAFDEMALRDFEGWLVKPVRRKSLVARLAGARRDATKASQVSGPVAELAGVHALVAEDNDVNALILTRCLEKLGAQADRARDGAEALAMAARAIESGANYDLFLVDLFMPELDGREVARGIRACEARARARRTPVIMLTASAREEDARAARAAGADAVLTKPVEFEALASKIMSLRLSRPLDAVEAPSAGYAPAGEIVPNLPER